MPDPTLPIEREEPNRALVWLKRNKKPFGFFAGLMLVVLASRVCSTNKAPSTLERTQQAITKSNEESYNQKIRELREELQAARNNNAQQPAAPHGRRVAPCSKAQVNRVRQDQYGGQLVCTEEDNGYWWEQIFGQQPSIYPEQPLTAGQLAQIQPPVGQGSQPGAAAPATGGAVAPVKKAPDLAVSFRDESSMPPLSQPAPAPPPAAQPVAEKPTAAPAPTPAAPANSAIAAATGPKYRIREGTLLPCTEMLRINGSFNGHINCLISIPIYSTGADHLLIPRYSLALGHTQAVSSQHQERLFVVFDKIIEPDGFTVEFPTDYDGLDQIGQNGLKDKIDRHFARIFGTSLAIAAIGGLAQVGNGAVVTPFAEYRAGVTESVSQSSMQVLNHMLDTMPTMVIREGARNQIYVVRDLYLEDFYRHHIKGEM